VKSVFLQTLYVCMSQKTVVSTLVMSKPVHCFFATSSLHFFSIFQSLYGQPLSPVVDLFFVDFSAILTCSLSINWLFTSKAMAGSFCRSGISSRIQFIAWVLASSLSKFAISLFCMF
jgi:hypothetical protein